MRKLSSDRALIAMALPASLPSLFVALPLVLTATQRPAHHGVVFCVAVVAVTFAITAVLVSVGWWTKRLVKSFADDVFDDGDALVFRRRRGRVEQRVDLPDIWQVVDYSHQHPPKVLVEFSSDAGPFGGKAVFMPREGRRSGALVKALRGRIDAAKGG